MTSKMETKKSFNDIEVGDYVYYANIDTQTLLKLKIIDKNPHYNFVEFFVDKPFLNNDKSELKSFAISDSSKPPKLDREDDLNKNEAIYKNIGVFIEFSNAFDFINDGMQKIYNEKKEDLEKYSLLMNEFKKEHYNETSNS
jgi:hypothetical protein